METLEFSVNGSEERRLNRGRMEICHVDVQSERPNKIQERRILVHVEGRRH